MTIRHITLSMESVIATQIATTQSSQNILGKLYAILYKPGTFDTNADITITTEGVTSYGILTVANAGTADILWYPRTAMHAVANGAALTATAGGDNALPLLCGAPKVVIAQSGATTARVGSVVIYYII